MREEEVRKRKENVMLQCITKKLNRQMSDLLFYFIRLVMMATAHEIFAMCEFHLLNLCLCLSLRLPYPSSKPHSLRRHVQSTLQ